MKVGDAFPSNWLTCADLGGRQVTVTIARWTIERMRDGKDKPALYFQGKVKGLVLNKTNARTIAKQLGTDELERWIGRTITLIPAMTEYQGEMVECVRILPPNSYAPPPPPPGPLQPPAPPEDFRPSDDDVPF